MAALVTGIIGLIFGPIPFTFWIGAPLALAAIILGAVALSRVRKGVATNKGVSMSGLVLGILAALASIVGAILFFVLLNTGIEIAECINQNLGNPDAEAICLQQIQ
ncbi:DUF4190 domain-containing protein [Sinosporangium siamense]|uniref:DUF4190 domain-containing protein n=1 Tax=Sinosporangium siamense TaxID=1367973 RepID=UPI00194FB3EE|nr:DUF4190 domain-containing protein [Sinosporangium siamense]